MSKQWHDEDIEQLLQQMPDVQDERRKEDVFAELQAAGAFEEQQEITNVHPMKKKNRWYGYGLSAAAIACIIAIPTLNSSTEQFSSNDQIEKADTVSMDMADNEQTESEQSIAAQSKAFTSSEMTYPQVLYADQVANELIVYGEHMYEGYRIPVVTTISKDGGTAEEQLKSTASAQLQELNYAVTTAPRHAQYVLIHEADGQKYAIHNESFATAKAAIEAYKQLPPYLISPIPMSYRYIVSETDDLVIVTFAEPYNAEQLPASDTTLMLEALSLTAMSYGKQVMVKNMVQTQWQMFDFSQPLPSIVGANRIFLQ